MRWVEASVLDGESGNVKEGEEGRTTLSNTSPPAKPSKFHEGLKY